MPKGVLLDTSFFLRFLNEADPLFRNADNYYRYFIQQNVPMFISTISVAEYCVGGSVEELPFKDVHVLPFNFTHARRTGEFARIVFDHKGKLNLTQRNIIPNDTKLFAQADVEENIDYYLSSDTESMKIYQLLQKESKPAFGFIDLRIPYSEVFGLLGFDLL